MHHLDRQVSANQRRQCIICTASFHPTKAKKCIISTANFQQTRGANASSVQQAFSQLDQAMHRLDRQL
jgi:hypothetical protein